MQLTDITKAFSSGDFARPNLFEVEITYLGNLFAFKCKAAPLPPGNVEKIPVGYQNRKINIAGDRTFDDWTVTIYNDDAHTTRQSIIDWQGLAHAQDNNIAGQRPSDYKKTATIRQYARDGATVTKEYTLTGIWPTVVGEIQMDWDENNSIETFEATFAMDWWV